VCLVKAGILPIVGLLPFTCSSYLVRIINLYVLYFPGKKNSGATFDVFHFIRRSQVQLGVNAPLNFSIQVFIPELLAFVPSILSEFGTWSVAQGLESVKVNNN
jgi:hypothetical protein